LIAPRGGAGGRCSIILVLALFSVPVAAGGDGSTELSAKIRFDLSRLDAAGLYGPPDGLRALSYEFCIPDRADTAARVREIDGSVEMHRSRGRVGCSGGELLCIGSTHQPGYREVLDTLAGLPYVTRIEQAFFE
jgi:hypothetical protein